MSLSRIISSAFFVVASFGVAVLPLCAMSATFYIDSREGSDSNDGLSPTKAWRTLTAANGRVRGVGDDLLLREGSVFEDQQLVIDWDGSDSDWTTVDCYGKTSSGQARACVDSDARPEVNGTFEPACAAAGSCEVFTADAVPSKDYTGLVDVAASNVIVRNLVIRDSASIPLVLKSNAKNRRHDFVFEDLIIEHSAARLIYIGSHVQGGVIRRVKGSLYGLCYKYEYATCKAKASPWSGGIVVYGSENSYVLVEQNEVHQGYGEGMICLRSSHMVYRNNRVGNVHAIPYYLDHCSNTVVENNIAWGDAENDWNANRAFAAVTVMNESYKTPTNRDSVNNIIRNNLFTGLGACIYAGQEVASREAGYAIGFHAYGNTCIGFYRSNVTLNNNISNVDRIVVQNNIFYSPDAQDYSCSSLSNPGISFSNNFWDGGKTRGPCRGEGDRVGNPMVRTSLQEFSAFNFRRQPEPSDFALQEGSPAGDGAKSLASGRLLNVADYGPIPSRLGNGCALSPVPLDSDFYCTERRANPNFGAIDRFRYPPLPPVLKQ